MTSSLEASRYSRTTRFPRAEKSERHLPQVDPSSFLDHLLQEISTKKLDHNLSKNLLFQILLTYSFSLCIPIFDQTAVYGAVLTEVRQRQNSKGRHPTSLGIAEKVLAKVVPESSPVATPAAQPTPVPVPVNTAATVIPLPQPSNPTRRILPLVVNQS